MQLFMTVMTNTEPTKLSHESSNDNKEDLRDFLEKMQSETLDIDNNLESDYFENRTALRFANHDIEVWVKVLDVFKTGKYEKFTLFNISFTGAKIRANRKLKIGKKLALQFIFNDQTKYFMLAEIIRQKDGDDESIYGIKFEQKNSFFSDKLVQTEFKIDDVCANHVNLGNNPDAFVEAINTFFSLEERLYLKKCISTK